MGAEGYALAGPVWKNTLINTLKGKTDEKFPMPSTVVQRQTCYSNHGIATNNSTYQTYGEYYLSTALPSTTCAPVQPKPINVCNLKTKKIDSVDENTLDTTTYSKDLTACQQPDPDQTISVCNLSTNQIVTIKESEFDSTKYSRDTSSCSTSTGTGGTGTGGVGTGGGTSSSTNVR